jgi:hypothetical protein
MPSEHSFAFPFYSANEKLIDNISCSALLKYSVLQRNATVQLALIRRLFAWYLGGVQIRIFVPSCGRLFSGLVPPKPCVVQ